MVFQRGKRAACFLFVELLHSYGLWPLAHQPYFPMLQHSGINYPPATGWSPHSRPGCQFYRNQRFLNVMDLHPMTTIPCPHSRKELRFANFPFDSFRILIFYKETFHFSPRNLRIEDFADPSRRLADLWSPEGIHTVPNPVGICRQQTKFAALWLIIPL